MMYELDFKQGGLKPIETIKEAENLKRGDIIRWGGNMAYLPEDLIILEKVTLYENRMGYKAVNVKRSHEAQEEYIPHIKTIEAFNIKNPADKNSYWHTQHYFLTDKTATEEEINAILDFIPIAIKREQDKKEAEIRTIKEAGQLTQTEKINLSTSEIVKQIRQKIKEKFKNCKFSVTKNSYSGGCSITISLMEANFKVFKDFKDLSERAINKYTAERYTEAQLKEMCLRRYAQLNHYTIREDYNPDLWNNGQFLTEQAHNTLKEAVNIAQYYNYDNSDSMTDYFDVNFYLNLAIGKYDKPFKEVA